MVKSGLDYGEYFTESDHVQGSKKVILGCEVAAHLFPDGNAAGKTRPCGGACQRVSGL